MLARERQNTIYEMVNKSGAVSTSELMEKMGVSIETVRRDLLLMEKQSLLTRVHGGAVKGKGEMMKFPDLQTRNTSNSEQKRELARTALSLLEEGDIISLDSGSTASIFAQAIRDNFSSLTVITHSLDVFEILSGCDGIEVILCGGHYLREERAFYGPLVLQTLERMRIAKAFICPSAISMEFGIADFQAQLWAVQKQYVKSAERLFVLADSSKFEKKAMLKIDAMSQDYTYVTDSFLSPATKKLYRENKLEIIAKGK